MWPPVSTTLTTILLIRHGQSEGNAAGMFGGHTPTPLSEQGKQQAQVTAEALSTQRITAIYSSDLLRAIQTAEPLSQLTGLVVKKSSAFRERSVGVLEGLKFEDAAARYGQDYAALVRRDFEYTIEQGESYRQVLVRASQKLDGIIEEHRGGAVAIYSHTGTICILTLHLMGALDAAHLRQVWVRTENCGIARFAISSDNFVRVLEINDTRHLIRLQ
ncbi:MAG: histidine phosphatase family protein [Pyrinomonadaceae bacterium]